MILMPSAFAYFSKVESRMSSAWFSMREIADFFVRSFLAIASCVTPAHSRASRNMTLNSNASYPASKFFANFVLRAFRFSMYRSTSLMAFPSFVDIQCAVFAPVLPLAEAFSVAFSEIRSLGSSTQAHRRIQSAGSSYHQPVCGFPKADLCRRAFSITALELYQAVQQDEEPRLLSVRVGQIGYRGIPRRASSQTMFDRIQ